MKNRQTRLALLVASLVFIAIAMYRTAFDLYAPSPIPGAYVQLAFHKDIANIGSDDMTGTYHDGSIRYVKGVDGHALYAKGDGSWLEYRTASQEGFRKAVEVSFDFRPEPWTNPYKQGAAVKTIAVISGKSNEKLRHLSFSISSSEDASLSVSIENANGVKAQISSPPGMVSWTWHKVRLVADVERALTQVYLDGVMIGEADIIPAPIEHGYDRIKFGTWFKQNQAYRGLIDSFVVKDG